MKRMTCWLAFFCILAFAVLPVQSLADRGGIPVGGIRIRMTDLTGQPLPDASFLVLRTAQDGELGDHDTEKKMVKIEDEHRIMTVERFWTSREMTGEKTKDARTASDGTVSVYGLNYGTYYLLETDAPEGYNRIRDPIRVTVHKYSHLTAEDGIRDDDGKLIDNTLQIINVRYTLPDTRTWGVVQLAAAGTGILFSSAALLLLGRKRR